MPKRNNLLPENFIVPLIMNGLQGRMLRLPPKRRKREILVVYGQQASLEHWWPFAVELNQYGAVTMPDLPGFGGMQSFYKISEKPTLNNLADYLAAFVKLRYKRKRLTIVGIGFGFVVATRMLSRSPDLAKKVDVLINVGGFTHAEDLTLSRTRRLVYRTGAMLLTFRLPALVVRNVFLHPSILHYYAKRSGNPKPWEQLWRQNDLRTHFATLAAMMRLDNCKSRINLPIWHISMSSNQWVYPNHIEQHLHVIFPDVAIIKSRLRSKAIGTVNYNAALYQLLPLKVRRALLSKG